MLIDSPHLVRPGKKPHLSKIDTRQQGDFADKEAGVAATEARLADLDELQIRLYAESKRSLLIVLQAMDTGGKDGAIKSVFTHVNPQGCAVTSFKAPSSSELARDYLWRVHANVPPRGTIGIFNRSHYEDVLVPAVKGWLPKERIKARYAHINAFEQMLCEEGTTILKFMLHISKDEQRERLVARQDDAAKHWKFNAGDLEARKDWDAYQKAYEETIAATSTEHAPWYVVPADRKWFRNYVLADVIVGALERMKPEFPEAAVDPRTFVVE